MGKKIFLIKFFSISCLFIISSLVIEKNIYKRESKKTQSNYFGSFEELDKLNVYLRSNTEIILFGDSVATHTRGIDNDNRDLGKFLQDEITNSYKVGLLSHGAYHSQIYEVYTDYICNAENPPKYIIVPINLRSFSLAWDKRPSYRFSNETAILKSRTKFTPFTAFNVRLTNLFGKKGSEQTKAEEEFKKTPIMYKDQQIGTVGDFEISEEETKSDPSDEREKEILISQYLYNLPENHAKLVSLKKIAQNSKECGIKAVFYITPIDYEEGGKFIGEEFVTIVNNNIDTIEQSLEEYNIPLLNLAFDLPHQHFSVKYVPNEHVFSSGKKYIAQKVAQIINENQ